MTDTTLSIDPEGGNVTVNQRAKDSASRIAVIDVLRLFAALGVLVFHAAGTAEMPKHVLPTIYLFGHTIRGVPSPFSFGATGVSLFFVISGYCMYISFSRSTRDLKSYYQSRFARIYPAYFIAVIFSVILMEFCGFSFPLTDIISKLLFLHGFIQEYNLSINGALWSMATEVQFYLTLPALFLFAKRIGARHFWVGCLLLSLGFRLSVTVLLPHDNAVGGIVTSTFLDNLLPGRLSEFATGMLIAASSPGQMRRLALLGIIPVSLVALTVRVVGPSFAAEPLLGLFYGAVLILLLRRPGVFGPQNGPLAAMGRASYALFLLHLPVTVALAAGMKLSGSPFAQLGTLIGPALLLSMLLAFALHAWVEMPLFKRMRPTSRPADAGAP